MGNNTKGKKNWPETQKKISQKHKKTDGNKKKKKKLARNTKKSVRNTNKRMETKKSTRNSHGRKKNRKPSLLEARVVCGAGRPRAGGTWRGHALNII
jgi:hypothetical protein